MAIEGYDPLAGEGGMFMRVAIAVGALALVSVPAFPQSQEQRIADLERAVIRLEAEVFGRAQVEHPAQPSGIVRNGWRSLANWGRVKKGMSSDQVVSLLGRPTSVDNFGTHYTYFYQGQVTGVGRVTGLVKLNNDRVWMIEPPVM
jgi:hypothetical protein